MEGEVGKETPKIFHCFEEALENGMCDIKIRQKRRDATRSGKRNQPINILNSCRAANFKARITKV